VKKTISFISFSLVCFFFLLSFSGCGGCQKTAASSSNQASSSEDLSMSPLIKIKPGQAVVLDSIEKFIQVYILFNYEQRKWVNEYNATTNNKMTGEDFLSQKRKDFYKSLGLTEEEFTQYSTSNVDKIQTFLDKNPDYKRVYEDSLKDSLLK
jgi:hypothetical protein